MTLGPIRNPQILSKILSQNRAEIGLLIPNDLAYFEGHFPNFPILPGIVQLHWAVEFAKEIFKVPEAFSGGSQIKFNNLIPPLVELCLILEHFPEKYLIMYSYKADQKTYSSGRLIYSNLWDMEKLTNEL